MNKILVCTKKELLHLVDILKSASKYDDSFQRAFAIDTETYTPDGSKKALKKEGLILDRARIMYISIARNDTGWGIPLSGFGKGLPTDFVMDRLEPFLCSKSILKICHNCNYDVNMFKNHGIKFNLDSMYCTMIAGHAWDERLPLSLKERCVLVGMRLRATKTVNMTDLKDITEYAVDDALATWRLYEAYERGRSVVIDGKKRNMLLKGARREFFNMEMEALKGVIRMERRGVKIDVPAMKLIDKRIDKKLNFFAKKIYIKNGSEFNIASRQQLSDFLFDKLKLPVLFETPSGRPSTDKFTLSSLRSKSRYVDFVVQYNALKSLKHYVSEDKGLFLYADSNNRIHATYSQVGARTARASVSIPNLQQIPSKTDTMGIRSTFIAGPGRKLIVADMDQLELRLMANHSRDPMMLRAYEKGISIHIQTGVATGLLPKGVTKEDIKGKLELSRAYMISKNCVTGDALVKTTNGLLRLDEIISSDKERQSISDASIYCEDGVVREVKEAICMHDKEVFELTTEWGIKLKLTPDHECMVIENGKMVRKRADTLVADDNLIMQYGSELHGNSTEIKKPGVESNTSYRPVSILEHLTDDFCKWLGLFVAEGSHYKSGTSYNISLGLGLQDPDIVAETDRLFNILFNDRVCKTLREDSVHWAISSKDLFYFLESLGLGCSSERMCIPKLIRIAPWNFKRAFLRAYFEGDGSVSNGSIRCCSKSEELIRQIQAELLNIGVIGTVFSEYRENYGVYWLYQIGTYAQICIFKDRIGFLSDRKNKKLDKAASLTKASKDCIFFDGFELGYKSMLDNLHGKPRYKLDECRRAGIRLGYSRLESINPDIWPSELKSLVNAHMCTVKIKSLRKLNKKEIVYDLYEPEHTSMVCNGLLIADCNFGLMYEGTAWTLRNQLILEGLNISEDECEDIVHKYWGVYSGVPEYRNNLYALCREKGFITNICGRHYRITNYDSPVYKLRKAAERQIVNTVIQGGGADWLKLSMIRIDKDEELRDYGYRMLLAVHDEIVGDCKEKWAEKAAARKKALMETSPDYLTIKLRVPLTASAGIAGNWKDAK